MNLFFGKAKSKTTAKDAIYKLRETLGMLEKRQTFLETKAENELKIAKLNATKNRNGKKKYIYIHISKSSHRLNFVFQLP